MRARMGGGAANAMILAAPASAIPTLSQWTIAALALLLMGIGIFRVRRIRP